jgi:hypothetical protein
MERSPPLEWIRLLAGRPMRAWASDYNPLVCDAEEKQYSSSSAWNLPSSMENMSFLTR